MSLFVRSSRVFARTSLTFSRSTFSIANNTLPRFVPTYATQYRYFCSGTLKSPEEIKNFEKVPADKVTEKSHFSNDLGLDSLDTVELVLALENEFSIEIPDDAANNINSVEEAISYLATNPHLK